MFILDNCRYSSKWETLLVALCDKEFGVEKQPLGCHLGGVPQFRWGVTNTTVDRDKLLDGIHEILEDAISEAVSAELHDVIYGLY